MPAFAGDGSNICAGLTARQWASIRHAIYEPPSGSLSSTIHPWTLTSCYGAPIQTYPALRGEKQRAKSGGRSGEQAHGYSRIILNGKLFLDLSRLIYISGNLKGDLWKRLAGQSGQVSIYFNLIVAHARRFPWNHSLRGIFTRWLMRRQAAVGNKFRRHFVWRRCRVVSGVEGQFWFPREALLLFV